MSVLVSIIITVFRSENTLKRCVDSVLCQTYRNIEVILVDDGSPDSSGDICDKYALRDNRVKVIHQDNGGVSVARQVGMENANGEYTIHVDSDDWIEPTMIEELIFKAIEDNADMVICDYVKENLKNKYIVRQNIRDISCESLIKKMLYQQIHGCCWNKLVRRKCYRDLFFQPSNISFSEDLLSNLRLLKYGIKVSYLPRVLYHYVDNMSSICHMIDERNINSKKNVVEILRNELRVDDEDLFYLKKMVLYDMLQSKRLKEMMNLYPEITSKIKSEKGSLNFFTPYKTWLYVAKCGYPKFSYIMLTINLKIIEIRKKMQFV